MERGDRQRDRREAQRQTNRETDIQTGRLDKRHLLIKKRIEKRRGWGEWLHTRAA